jgi:hypothetical protein
MRGRYLSYILLVQNLMEILSQMINENPSLPKVEVESLYLSIKGTPFLVKDIETSLHCHPVNLFISYRLLDSRFFF